jgi:hypothetical protein
LDNRDWRGPYLIPRPDLPEPSDINAVFAPGQGFLIAYSSGSTPLLESLGAEGGNLPPMMNLGGVQEVLSATEILQDSDGDGWTDHEEVRLGLDPANSDTDGDGLTDWVDVCPDLAQPESGDRDEDTSRILEKAIFAVYGLAGAKQALIVDEKADRVHLTWGYGGPILYNSNLRSVLGPWWRIYREGESEAVVDLNETYGRAGRSLRLRKINGKWYVVELLGVMMQ